MRLCSDFTMCNRSFRKYICVCSLFPESIESVGGIGFCLLAHAQLVDGI